MRAYLAILLVGGALSGCRGSRVNTKAEAVVQVRAWTLAHGGTTNMLLDSASARLIGKWWHVGVPKSNCRNCIPDHYAFRVRQRTGKVVPRPLK